jgi:hypothetical protein
MSAQASDRDPAWARAVPTRGRPDRSGTSDEAVVELADRQSEEFDIALYWSRRTGRLWVRLVDRPSRRWVRIAATEMNALDVYYHPNAHAQLAA